MYLQEAIQMFDLIVRNAAVVNHDGVVKADIAVASGRIVRVAPDIKDAAGEVVDASELYAFPGMIDAHVHISEPDYPYADDLAATTRAAAAGGMTTVIDFLAEGDTLMNQLERRLPLMDENAWVDVAFHAGVFTEGHIGEMEECRARGITSFKLYLPFRGKDAPEGWELTDEKLRRIMKKTAAMGGSAIVTFHAENVYADGWDPDEFMAKHPQANWNEIRPARCETADLERMAKLSEETGCPIYMVHMSAKSSVETMGKLQKSGIRIVGETCVHYLTLAASECDRELTKVNPPIREREDIETLWRGIKDGVVTIMASDHYSARLEQKRPFADGLPGFPGVQTTLPVLLSEGVNKGRISLEKVAEICSFNPAKVFGLYPRKGEIAPGFDADIVLVDLTKKHIVRASELYHISDYTPFEGMEVASRPVMTFLRGKKVAENGHITAGSASGRYLARE